MFRNNTVRGTPSTIGHGSVPRATVAFVFVDLNLGFYYRVKTRNSLPPAGPRDSDHQKRLPLWSLNIGTVLIEYQYTNCPCTQA